jgi:hypothetical protein
MLSWKLVECKPLDLGAAMAAHREMARLAGAITAGRYDVNAPNGVAVVAVDGVTVEDVEDGGARGAAAAAGAGARCPVVPL